MRYGMVIDSKRCFGTQTTQDRLIQELVARHAGEDVVYASCAHISCEGSCILKARLKNGTITAIEPDDRYNPGIPREDRVLSDLDLIQARVQRRACPMAWVWHKHLYDPQRILYPLLREPGSERGQVRFQRITWEEALDILVGKMEHTRQRYGPYSIMTPYMPNSQAERLFSFWGAGVDTWGWCSSDPEKLVTHLMTGNPGWSYRGSSSAADVMMNAKLIVLWGLEPSVTHLGPGHQFAWYIKMARERGTPVICIDPRYTTGAEVIADQWLPIKPGTDMAFMLAIAYVLFSEDLYNRDFVSRFVEPEGFEKWRRYVLGKEDGVAKTPQWAEAVCGLPAETIVEFTRLYARSKPTWLWKHWSVARKSRGENSARGAAALQSMMGYFGVPGGVMPFVMGHWPLPEVASPPYGGWGDYQVPKVCRSHKWSQAVLLLDQVRSGELTEVEWRARVGYRGDPELPIPRDFNPKFLWWGSARHTASNHLCTGCDSTNDQIKAMLRMDFIPYFHTTMTPTARYADLILPSLDWVWEGQRLLTSTPSGFSAISYAPGVVKPPGEVRPVEWVYTKIAERLGFAKEFNRYYTSDDNWEADWGRFLDHCYNSRIIPALSDQGIEAPTWEEFKGSRMINVDEFHDEPHVGFQEEIRDGRPFKTKSGKFEVCADLLEDEAERGKFHCDHLGHPIDDLPNDFRDLQSIPRYQPAVGGMDDGSAASYPLMMLTPHCRYRAHSHFWTVPWLRGDCYRHSVWLSPADAHSRGIRDGDIVRVFNDRGEIRLPAYVTSRIMPGVVAVHQGAWYVDPGEIGGAPHTLLGDTKSPVTAPHATTAVQIEKV